MRAVLQRVSSAFVLINEQEHSRIGRGFLVLVGIEQRDETEDADYLAQKIAAMRVFGDADGRMNLDAATINGELLVVSQFTLHALTNKGNRPSFIRAARPEQAIPLYEYFLKACAAITGKLPLAGIFGADMKVALVNDGPVTIIIDSKNRE